MRILAASALEDVADEIVAYFNKGATLRLVSTSNRDNVARVVPLSFGRGYRRGTYGNSGNRPRESLEMQRELRDDDVVEM